MRSKGKEVHRQLLFENFLIASPFEFLVGRWLAAALRPHCVSRLQYLVKMRSKGKEVHRQVVFEHFLIASPFDFLVGSLVERISSVVFLKIINLSHFFM